VVSPTYNTWGLMGGRRGIDIWNQLPYLGHSPVYHALHIYPIQITHISLSCTVYDREMWIFAEFTCKDNEQQKRMCMPFELIGTIPTNYQPLKLGRFLRQSPSFLQQQPEVCKVGHFCGQGLFNANSIVEVAPITHCH